MIAIGLYLAFPALCEALYIFLEIIHFKSQSLDDWPSLLFFFTLMKIHAHQLKGIYWINLWKYNIMGIENIIQYVRNILY
jgi:hypothetical protein